MPHDSQKMEFFRLKKEVEQLNAMLEFNGEIIKKLLDKLQAYEDGVIKVQGRTHYED